MVGLFPACAFFPRSTRAHGFFSLIRMDDNRCACSYLKITKVMLKNGQNTSGLSKSSTIFLLCSCLETWRTYCRCTSLKRPELCAYTKKHNLLSFQTIMELLPANLFSPQGLLTPKFRNLQNHLGYALLITSGVQTAVGCTACRLYNIRIQW